MIKVKNHQKLATVRDDMALKIKHQVIEQAIYLYKGLCILIIVMVKLNFL